MEEDKDLPKSLDEAKIEYDEYLRKQSQDWKDALDELREDRIKSRTTIAPPDLLRTAEDFSELLSLNNKRMASVIYNSLFHIRYEGFTDGFSKGTSSKIKRYEKAMKQVIEMNYQNAEDQYGDRSKAKSWSCVSVLEEALGIK